MLKIRFYFIFCFLLSGGPNCLGQDLVNSSSFDELLDQFIHLQKEYLSLEEKVKGLERERLVFPSICEGRLSLVTGTPVGPGSAKTTLYFTPSRGNKITLYDGANWKLHTFSELSITNAGLTQFNVHDVFIYSNSGTPTVELSAAWTNSTTRATALTTQDGIYVMSGDSKRRYVGTIYLHSGATFYDTSILRYVWNHCNRVTQGLSVANGIDSGSTSGTTWTKYLTNPNAVRFVIGLPDVLVSLRLLGLAEKTVSAALVSVGMGANSSTVNSAVLMGGETNTIHTSQVWGDWTGYPGIGAHNYYPLWTTDGTSVTFLGDNGGTLLSAGYVGNIWGG